MANRSYTSRHEVEEYSFHPAVTIAVPVVAVVLGALLLKWFPRAGMVDLPLIVTIFFAVAWRNPINGTVTGALIGLFQDALTHQPLGIFGMAKSLIGYMAASVGVRIDVENIITRAIMAFGFSLVQSMLLYLIQSRLLGINGLQVLWLHELIRAAVNTVAAVPVFFLLDRTKRQA